MFAILNARYHEQEAYIVSQAGVPGAMTIATNMAGRGTDIQLGGNADMRIRQELADVTDEAERTRRTERNPRPGRSPQGQGLEAGGLFVLGTERHEMRRIDNQLRGRSGRQGDPGHSKFFLSLQDDLMRIFGSDKLDGMLQRLGLQENEAIVHPWINKALEKAQQKVEARNFDIRKNVLKFDNVMNDQRKVIFDQRIELMKDENVAERSRTCARKWSMPWSRSTFPENAYPEQWDTKGLKEEARQRARPRTAGRRMGQRRRHRRRGADPPGRAPRRRAHGGQGGTVGPRRDALCGKVDPAADARPALARALLMLEHLRQVIGLRGYGQRDPLNEYKSEAFQLFEALISRLREAVTAPADAGRDPAGAAAGTGKPAVHGGAPYRSDHRRGRVGDVGCGRHHGPQCRGELKRRRPREIPRTRRVGARSAATRPARAVRARSSSTATGGSGKARFARIRPAQAPRTARLVFSRSSEEPRGAGTCVCLTGRRWVGRIKSPYDVRMSVLSKSIDFHQGNDGCLL